MSLWIESLRVGIHLTIFHCSVLEELDDLAFGDGVSIVENEGFQGHAVNNG